MATIPDEIDKIDQFLFEGDNQYVCYSKATRYGAYQTEASMLNKFNRVKITGDGGGDDVHRMVAKGGDLLELRGTLLISFFADTMIYRPIFNTEGYRQISDRFKNHYLNTYSNYLDNHNQKPYLPLIYFYLERIGNYQSSKLAGSRLNKNIYMPYVNDAFVKLVFASSTRDLIRSRRNSVHHRLHLKFTNGQAKKIPFATSWN